MCFHDFNFTFLDPKVAALNYDSFSFSYDKIVGTITCSYVTSVPLKRWNVAHVSDCFAASSELLSRVSFIIISFSLYIIHHKNVTGKWMMPWVMQAIDTRIVNRSNALTGWRYGRNLVYRELAQAPNMIAAAIGSALFPIVGAMLYFSLTRCVYLCWHLSTINKITLRVYRERKHIKCMT